MDINAFGVDTEPKPGYELDILRGKFKLGSEKSIQQCDIALRDIDHYDKFKELV